MSYRQFQYQCQTCGVVAPRDGKKAQQHRDEHRSRAHDGMVPKDRIVELNPPPFVFRLIEAVFRLVGALLAMLFELLKLVPPVARFAEGPSGKKAAAVLRDFRRVLATAMVCVLVLWFTVTLLIVIWKAISS
ncbi:MAG: hypothetical protein ACTHZ5_16045 [Micrococcaceae bacterium]